MSKKAVFIGPAHPYRGGIAAFNENLASTFQNNGWECKIFTFIQQYPNILFPGKDQLAPGTQKPNLKIKRAIYSTNPLNWLKISKQIVEEKPDIIITQYWMPFMAPAFGTILRGVKKALKDTRCITVVHNFKPHESRIGDKQLNKFIANRTDLMVSLSENVKQDIETSIPDKPIINLFHPIYDHYGEKQGKQAACEILDLDPEKKYLLFFGLVRAYKGLDLLIDALEIVEKKSGNHDYKLIIAGEFYENEKKYRKRIEEKGLAERIIVRNKYIPNDEVPFYFGAVDAVILPYKTATQSGVIPVAIHFDKHVIVSMAGGLSEIIHEHRIGLICDKTPESFAENILKLFEGQAHLSTDFSAIKQNLSWQSFFDNFIREIENFDGGHQKYN